MAFDGRESVQLLGVSQVPYSGPGLCRTTFIQYIYPSPFAGASLQLLIAGKLSVKNLPVVPSLESNSGLPYSRVLPIPKLSLFPNLVFIRVLPNANLLPYTYQTRDDIVASCLRH